MLAWHASGLWCFLCSHLQTNNRWTNEVLMWFGVLLLIKAMPQAWCLCKRHRTKCKRCGLYRRLKVTQDGEWEHKATCCQHLFRIHNISRKIVLIFIYMFRSSDVNTMHQLLCWCCSPCVCFAFWVIFPHPLFFVYYCWNIMPKTILECEIYLLLPQHFWILSAGYWFLLVDKCSKFFWLHTLSNKRGFSQEVL